jgi:hypothetical protein
MVKGMGKYGSTALGIDSREFTPNRHTNMKPTRVS